MLKIFKEIYNVRRIKRGVGEGERGLVFGLFGLVGFSKGLILFSWRILGVLVL